MEATPGSAGAHTSMPARIIVARAGVFRPRDPMVTSGEVVAQDERVGMLEALGTEVPVRSPFRGRLMGMMAIDDARLVTGEAIAWMRCI